MAAICRLEACGKRGLADFSSLDAAKDPRLTGFQITSWADLDPDGSRKAEFVPSLAVVRCQQAIQQPVFPLPKNLTLDWQVIELVIFLAYLDYKPIRRYLMIFRIFQQVLAGQGSLAQPIANFRWA